MPVAFPPKLKASRHPLSDSRSLPSAIRHPLPDSLEPKYSFTDIVTRKPDLLQRMVIPLALLPP